MIRTRVYKVGKNSGNNGSGGGSTAISTNSTTTNNITAQTAQITDLRADNIDASIINAENATIDSLTSININSSTVQAGSVNTTDINATNGSIDSLHSDNLEAGYIDVLNDMTVENNLVVEGNTTTGNISAEGDIDVTGLVEADRFRGQNAIIDHNLTADSINTDYIEANGGNIYRLEGDNLTYSGGSIDNLSSSNITTEYLTVTKQAHFFSLIIDEIKSVGGQVLITAGNAELDLVEEMDDRWRCYFQSKKPNSTERKNNYFKQGDQCICQTFNAAEGVSYNVSNKYYWRYVMGTGTVQKTIHGVYCECHYIDLSKADCDEGSGIPEEGDKVAQLGYRLNDDDSRQSAIIISAYNSIDTELSAPFYAQYIGINDYELSSHRYTWFAANGNAIRGDLLVESGASVEDYIRQNIASVYRIIPSTNVVTINSSGSVSPNAITAQIAITEGQTGSNVSVVPSGKNLRFEVYEEDTLLKSFVGGQTITTTLIDSTKNYYQFKLKKSNNVIDSYKVSVVRSAPNTYTWVKYSDNYPTRDADIYDNYNVNTTQYKGEAYNKTSPTPSTHYTDYIWTRINGLDAVSVVDIVNYYLATDRATGITNASSGFTTTPQNISELLPYLWEYTVTILSNGQQIKSPAVITAHYGKDGLNGRDGIDAGDAYFHVAYANKDEYGAIIDFSIDIPEGRKYLGTYVDDNEADSTDPSDYTWMKVEGAQGEMGIPGTNGADGRTSYLHIKYSNDGGQHFTSNNGETVGDWLGQYVDFSQPDSTDVTRYKWSLIKGADGADGTGIQIKGTKNSQSELPTTGNVEGDAYIIGQNLFIWTGTQWKDVGQFKGSDGQDGQTPYYHVAWANSADGTVDFTVAPVSGVTYAYRGEYVDYNQPDSQDPTRYYWSSYVGRGILSVEDYWLISEFSTGITRTTPRDGTWTTSQLVPTQVYRYLWHYEKRTWSDGSIDYSDAHIACVYGNNATFYKMFSLKKKAEIDTLSVQTSGSVVVNNVVIDLEYKVAKIDGDSYTLLDTQGDFIYKVNYNGSTWTNLRYRNGSWTITTTVPYNENVNSIRVGLWIGDTLLEEDYIPITVPSKAISDIVGDAIVHCVSDADGKISIVRQTADSILQRINNFNGESSTLEQTINSIISQVQTIQNDYISSSTFTQLSSSITQRVQSIESNYATKSELEQTASSLTSTITSVQQATEDLNDSLDDLYDDYQTTKTTVSELEQTSEKLESTIQRFSSSNLIYGGGNGFNWTNHLGQEVGMTGEGINSGSVELEEAGSTVEYYEVYSPMVYLEQGKKYCYSQYNEYGVNRFPVVKYSTSNKVSPQAANITVTTTNKKLVEDTWKDATRYSVTFTAPANGYYTFITDDHEIQEPILYHPQLELGEEPTAYNYDVCEAESQIRQTADEILMRVGDCGIDITNQKITLDGNTEINGNLSINNGEQGFTLHGLNGDTVISPQSVGNYESFKNRISVEALYGKYLTSDAVYVPENNQYNLDNVIFTNDLGEIKAGTVLIVERAGLEFHIGTDRWGIPINPQSISIKFQVLENGVVKYENPNPFTNISSVNVRYTVSANSNVKFKAIISARFKSSDIEGRVVRYQNIVQLTTGLSYHYILPTSAFTLLGYDGIGFNFGNNCTSIICPSSATFQYGNKGLQITQDAIRKYSNGSWVPLSNLDKVVRIGTSIEWGTNLQEGVFIAGDEDLLIYDGADSIEVDLSRCMSEGRVIKIRRYGTGGVLVRSGGYNILAPNATSCSTSYRMDNVLREFIYGGGIWIVC